MSSIFPPGEIDYTFIQGAKFESLLTYEDANGIAIDISDRKGRLQIRLEKDTVDPALHQILSDGSPPANNILIIGPDVGEGLLTGQVLIRIGATVMDTFSFDSAVYDLELERTADADDVIRLTEGKIEMNFQVTR